MMTCYHLNYVYSLSRYNDMSPLENHHCAVSFKILSSPECNIFMNLSPEEFKEVRGVSTNANIAKLSVAGWI